MEVKSCVCEPQRIVGGCQICNEYTCEECHDTGLTTIRGMCGGVEMDCDDQPCWACEGISKPRASKSLGAQEKA